MMPICLLSQYEDVYVATAYTLYPAGRDAAAAEAERVTSELMLEGVPAYSPIAHSHAVAKRNPDIPINDPEFWYLQNLPRMKAADAMVLVEMLGWENSVGIAMELEYFRDAGKPVHRLNPSTMELR